MSWCFVEEDSFIFITEINEMRKTTVVSKVKSSGVAGTVKVSFIEGEKKDYLLRDFKPSRNPLSTKFKDCLSSRSTFVKQFDEVASSLRESESSTVDDTDSFEGSVDVSGDDTSITPLVKSSRATCTEVHLDNLVGPCDGRAVRPVQSTHVSELVDAFAKTQSQYKILVGLIVEGCIDRVHEPGQCKIEVLGGNHTRLAIQELHKRGAWKSPLLNVYVYHSISDEECLRLGISHNQVDMQAMAMSFMDEVRLIRKLQQRSDARQIMQRVFSLKSITEVRHNLKTHESVAKCTQEVWKKVIEVESAWNEKKLLKQTFFTKWLLVKNDDERLSLLGTYLQHGMVAYKEAVCRAAASTKVSRVIEKKQGDNSENNKSLKEENARLKKTLQEREEDLQEKDSIIRQLKEQIEQLTQTVPIRKGDSEEKVEKRRKVSSQGDQQKSKKVKFSAGSDAATVSVGSIVWAKYADGMAYPAKVLEFNNSTNMFKVQYVEDRILREVKLQDMVLKDK